MSKTSHVKSRSHSQRGSPPAGRPGNRRFSFLHWFFGILCLVFAGVGVFAALEFLIWSSVPSALVGKWQVREGASAAIFEFTRNGTLQVRVNNQKQNPSRVSVEDRTMFTTMVNASTLREETRKCTIRELTAESLVLEFEDGKEMKLTRMR